MNRLRPHVFMIRKLHLLATSNLIDSILASPQILKTYPFYRLYDYLPHDLMSLSHIILI